MTRRGEQSGSARSALVLVLIILGLRTVVAVATNYIPKGIFPDSNSGDYLRLMIRELCIIGLPAFIYVRWWRPGQWREIFDTWSRPSWRQSLQTLLASVVGLFFLTLVSNLWMAFLLSAGITPPMAAVSAPGNALEVILAVVAIALVPALCEEVFFRGILLTSLRRELPFRWALSLSALLFALMHGSLAALPVHIWLGFLLGMLVARHGSLQLAIVYHIGHNVSSLLYEPLVGKLSPFGSLSQGLSRHGPGGLAAQLLYIAVLVVLSGLCYYALLRPLLDKPEAVAGGGAETPPVIGEKRLFLLVGLAVLCMLLMAVEYVLPLLPA